MKHVQRNILIIGCCFLAMIHAKTTKRGPDVFEKWIKLQHVLREQPASDMSMLLNENTFQAMRNHYEENILLLAHHNTFLTRVTAGNICPEGYQFNTAPNSTMQAILTDLYTALDENFPHFIHLLKQHNFSSADITLLEQTAHFDTTVDKYKALLRFFFKNVNTFKEDEFLFNVANRIFEYCFSPETFFHYHALLNDVKEYSIIRFLHSALWYHLVGDGWKHWHHNTLNSLKEAHENGKRIIYPAGGTDIYMLLQQGIYNVTIIDPFLPSQQRFYSEGWEWLVDGDIHDEIIFCPPHKNLILTRSSHAEQGFFYAKLSTGSIAQLPQSKTIWDVKDGDSNELLGTIIIERRLVKQDDFSKQDDTLFVFSYDELVCAVAPDYLGGWGIDPQRISPDFIIMGKQLRRPVTTTMLKYIRLATQLNAANVKFINFASDPT